MRRLFALVLLCSSLAFAGTPTGQLTKFSTTWNGLPRYYAVYVPKVPQAAPALVLFLHATSANASTNPPYYNQEPWELLADQYGFIMVWPVSSYNHRAGEWYWDCFFMDFSFPVHPDDVGFVRSVITNVAAAHSVDPNRVFVTGMSSGGFMTHRLGAEASDLVAAIAPVSAQVDVEQAGNTFVLPPILAPISVLDMHGDRDNTVPYCGAASKTYWGEPALIVPSLDDTARYWRTQNSCSDSVPRLCTKGFATKGVFGLDAVSCNNGVEVKFVREVGIGHEWVPGTETTVWSFFQKHAR
jgi:poly(hydroxyalkanoate) depolymerase family esterase